MNVNGNARNALDESVVGERGGEEKRRGDEEEYEVADVAAAATSSIVVGQARQGEDRVEREEGERER